MLVQVSCALTRPLLCRESTLTFKLPFRGVHFGQLKGLCRSTLLQLLQQSKTLKRS